MDMYTYMFMFNHTVGSYMYELSLPGEGHRQGAASHSLYMYVYFYLSLQTFRVISVLSYSLNNIAHVLYKYTCDCHQIVPYTYKN